MSEADDGRTSIRRLVICHFQLKYFMLNLDYEAFRLQDDYVVYMLSTRYYGWGGRQSAG